MSLAQEKRKHLIKFVFRSKQKLDENSITFEYFACFFIAGVKNQKKKKTSHKQSLPSAILYDAIGFTT